MKITALAPNEAVCDQPQKLIILAEYLPQHKGDVEVMFSIGNWSKRVKPDFEHKSCALQVSTPTPGFEITQRIQAEVKLVRKSNNASTEPLKFFFLPPKTNDGQFGLILNQDLPGSLLLVEGQMQTLSESSNSNTIDVLEDAVYLSNLSETGMHSTGEPHVFEQSTKLDLNVTQEWTGLDDIFMQDMENCNFGFNFS